MTDVADTNVDLNAHVEYDDSLATEAKKYPLIIADTWMYGKIVKAVKTLCKTGTYQVTATVVPLDSEGRECKPSVPCKLFLYMRRANGTAPDTMRSMYYFFHAIDPEMLKWHRKLKDTQKFVSVDENWDNGEEVSLAEYNKRRTEVNLMVGHRCTDLWNNPEELVGHEFYFMVKHEKDKKFDENEKIWASVSRQRLVAPEDEEIEQENFLHVDEVLD